MQSSWLQKACIVGLGAHARTKLIPALLANGQEVVAAVTSQSDTGVPGARRFDRLDDAVAQLPPGTAFIVSTPPALHFGQVRTILTAGRDVFVEKPAFATEAEAQALCELAARQGAVLFEGLMHRYTNAYEKLREYWNGNRGAIAGLTTKFLIPEMRGGTFRDNPDIASSIVFDFGSYPISLLGDLGLGDASLRISQAHHAGQLHKERVRIQGVAGALAIDIEIGMADAYENWIELTRHDGETLRVQPFYFGRKGDRTVTRNGATIETIADDNAFERMFRIPREGIMRNQASHLHGMIAATGTLEGLGAELARLRAGV